jgi:hypothetical protein
MGALANGQQVVKSFRYHLTDPRRFDIMQSGPGWGDRMQFDQLKRREFVTLLGGAAAWPLAAGAQLTMRVIGFLDSRLPDAITDRLRGFRQGLKDTSYMEGENVAIVYRLADNQDDRLPELAADLARHRIAVIATLAVGRTARPVAFQIWQLPRRL